MRARFIKLTNKFLRFRIFWFAKILSNVRLKGNFHIVSPTLFLSSNGGQIAIGDGVHLGMGCVVGAGSVATKSFEKIPSFVGILHVWCGKSCKSAEAYALENA